MNEKIFMDMKLGFLYKKEYTIFRTWSPNRKKISLALYDDYRHTRKNVYEMKRNSLGVFEVKIHGDLHLKFYTFILEDKYEITDPYSVASSINSLKSCVIDLERTNPEGFKDHLSPKNKRDESIIYEMHVKDYSAHESSGTKKEYRGKFLGVVDNNSSYNKISTGLNNLKDLGVTHVHLMPIYDFLTVDENLDKFFDTDNYNWGYDPELYNNIEGSYSTDPEDPVKRIYEFKKLVMDLHKNNISVIIDVVYNHTYRDYDSNFNILAPNYYYRINTEGRFSDGSGCGNEFKSESEMGRKFIVESLIYYVKEYKIDGFRFDLMALLDIDTANILINKLREINPNIIIYGEPWMASDSPLPLSERIIVGTQRGKDFALFNSNFRDAIKGDNDGSGRGYIQGDYYLKNEVETGICGSIDFDSTRKGPNLKANESINYFNSHDNLILMDKILKSVDDKEDINNIYKMAFNIIMTSLGTPFIHSGNEFMRDKKMHSNTYNKSLEVNAIDWQLKEKNIEMYNYISDLINFRKSRKEFNLVEPKLIKENMFFISFSNDSNIAYTIKNHNNKVLLIIHNCSTEKIVVSFKRIMEHLEHCYNITVIKSIVENFNNNGLSNIRFKKKEKEFLIERISTKIYEIEI